MNDSFHRAIAVHVRGDHQHRENVRQADRE